MVSSEKILSLANPPGSVLYDMLAQSKVEAATFEQIKEITTRILYWKM